MGPLLSAWARKPTLDAKIINKKKADNTELIKAQKAYLEEQWKLYIDYLEKESIAKKSARQKEIFELKKQFDSEYYNINATYQSRLVSEEKYRNQLRAINKKYDKLAKDDADKKRQDEINAAFASVNAIATHNRDKYYEDKLNNKTNLPLKEQLKTFKQDFEKMKNKEISYSTMRSIYG